MKNNLLRIRQEHAHGKVTFIELFFDLVFVFAITQLSHTLLGSFTASTALQVGLMLMAVWWVWIYTSWVTNWLDPEKTPVRIALLILMCAGLVLSCSIPKAFGNMGMTFAATYVLMQVGRSLFMLWAVWQQDTMRQNFIRISAWLALAGVFWILGSFFQGNLQFSIWAIALFIEYISPSTGFWIPILGRSDTSNWDVEGAHLAERCALFIIIALGESILVTGTTFCNLPWNPINIVAFMSAFVGSVAMWWIYFDANAEIGSKHITHADDPGKLARLAYTYIHLFFVAGIIVSAVADEFILTHPLQCVGMNLVMATLLGPGLYLTGNALFKRVISGKFPMPSVVGITALVALLFFAQYFSPLALSITSTLLLLIIAMAESCPLQLEGSDTERDRQDG